MISKPHKTAFINQHFSFPFFVKAEHSTTILANFTYVLSHPSPAISLITPVTLLTVQARLTTSHHLPLSIPSSYLCILSIMKQTNKLGLLFPHLLSHPAKPSSFTNCPQILPFLAFTTIQRCWGQYTLQYPYLGFSRLSYFPPQHLFLHLLYVEFLSRLHQPHSRPDYMIGGQVT